MNLLNQLSNELNEGTRLHEGRPVKSRDIDDVQIFTGNHASFSIDYTEQDGDVTIITVVYRCEVGLTDAEIREAIENDDQFYGKNISFEYKQPTFNKI